MFDRTRNTMLTTQMGLGVSLKKIAFLINSTLTGLTTDGKLLLYWLDKNNKIQSAAQKIPYQVIDFAVDPMQKGLIILALKANTIKVACADIRHLNSSGQILFQFLEQETDASQKDPSILTYHDNIVCHGDRMFQIFPKARLKKALCSKTN
jgi:hypothetical protein